MIVVNDSSSELGTLDDVAVLIPAYNCQADLAHTLDSLRETAPLNVLIVDDGSSPPLVTPKRAGLHIEMLRLEQNVGIERALQCGCEHLHRRGIRYIGRIDAGDRAVAGRFARQRAYLEQHREVGALGTWAEVVSMQGQPLFTLRPPTEPHIIRRRRFYRSCFIHPAMMLRTSAVMEAGNYRQAYRAAEDLDLFLRIMKRHACANLPEIGILYELNQGGISATRRRIQIMSTLKLQLHYFEPFNPYYWLGLCKQVLHLALPYRTLLHFKAAVLRH